MSNKYIVDPSYVLGEYVLTRDLQFVLGCNEKLVSSSEGKGIVRLFTRLVPFSLFVKKL